MKSSTLGLIIIVCFIVIGIISKGQIFHGGPIGIDIDVNPDNNGDGVIDESDSYSTGDQGNAYRNSSNTDYTDKVYISRVQNPGEFNVQITLGANLQKNESVLITGWKIKSVRSGQEMLIGGAANIANVGVTDQSAIVLTGRPRVIVSTRTSPIGTSFRVNMCSGYLAERNHFEPLLYTSCPRPIDDIPAGTRGLNDECLDYIQTLPMCRVPNTRDFPNREEDGYSLSNACESYLKTKVNYQSCMVNNVAKPNFLLNEWRVYTGFRGIFGFDRRDTLQLIDNLGRVVDSYEIN